MCFLPVVQSSSSQASQITRLNEQVTLLMEAQGDRERRLEEYLTSKSVKDIAVDLLPITCNLGPQATVDFVVAGGFDKEQLRIIRSVGVRMANEDQIKEEKKMRSLPMVHKLIALEAKGKEGESALEMEV